MSSKTPIRTVFNDSGVATGLAEFQTGEFIPLSHGGIGAALSIGSAGQVLKVNTGGSALEFGNVEAIVNIDGATDKTSATLVAGDQILLSDGGTEGRVTLSQLDTLFSGTSKTLTNKTIAAGSNTISGLTNSNLSGSAGITNANLANSAVTVGTTSISLGGSATTIAGISNLTAGGINITGNSITSADSSIIEMGEGLSVTGNLTVSGTQTIVNTETVTIDDNILVLNNNQSGSPTENAGIEVERGDELNKQLLWDESNDYWTVGSETFVANLFQGTATTARYADLAERYEADAQYDAGTVVMFGGDKEITVANIEATTKVAGVISTAPAYMMNSEAGNDATHPYVALAGRVPCKVEGPIAKGDLLVASDVPGYAKSSAFVGGAVIGKALENHNDGYGVIEILVIAM